MGHVLKAELNVELGSDVVSDVMIDDQSQKLIQESEINFLEYLLELRFE